MSWIGFKIFTSFEDLQLITTVPRAIDGFNIDTVKRDIVEYGRLHDLNIKGLDETIEGLKKDLDGFYFED